MKQNVLTSILYTLMDIITTTVLYLVFPIISPYIFMILLILVAALSAFKRYGVVTAIIITYVILAFITTLSRSLILLIPLLLLTYLITEAGIINDIAVISWTLLFTPFYWLSIPLSIAPSVKGYSIRSIIIFSLLSLLYVIGAAYQGILWTPITMFHVTNLSLVQGIEQLMSVSPGDLSAVFKELSDAVLYLVFVIIIAVPTLIGKYLPRLSMNWSMNTEVHQAIMNILPQLITASLLYIPLIDGTWNYTITPLIIVGSLIIGLGTYVLDIAQIRLGAGSQAIPRANKKPPMIIPVTDASMIIEYSYWAKKLPKDDIDLVNTVANTLTKTGIVALNASLPQDKIEIIAKVLFGVIRAKGFIIKGDFNELSDDINWFTRTNERSLLVLIPNEVSKDLITKLIEHNKQTKLYALIINGNSNALNRLRKYGIEVVNYSVPQGVESRQIQTKFIEEGKTEQSDTARPINVSTPSNNVGRDSQGISQSIVGTESGTKLAKVDGELGTGKGTGATANLLQPKEVIAREEKSAESPKPQVPTEKKEAVKEKTKAKGKGVSGNVVITLDPVDLIDMNVKSKLIDYIDSSIRLRDMMSNLGLRYITSILIIGPPRSGKTALINHVAKHLGVQIINYKDPSISITDNAVIHVPNLDKAINEDLNHITRLLNIAKAKHLVIVFESSNPWALDPNFIKKSIDVVIPVLPAPDGYVNEIIQNKLKVSNNRDQEIIRGIIKTCPAVEAIEKIRLYTSSGDGASIICEDVFRKYQDFTQSLVFK